MAMGKIEANQLIASIHTRIGQDHLGPPATRVPIRAGNSKAFPELLVKGTTKSCGTPAWVKRSKARSPCPNKYRAVVVTCNCTKPAVEELETVHRNRKCAE